MTARRAGPAAASPAGQRLGPAEILGIPRLPPAALTRVGTRVRSALGALHRRSAPAPARILDAALGGLDLAALTAICDLGLPERLRAPIGMADLADELRVDEGRLERLIQYAASRGWTRTDRQGRVRATRFLSFLERGHPGGWRAWIMFAAGAEVTAALGRLPAALDAAGDAFAAANGSAFFPWMQAHPDRHATFDAAMAAGGRMHGLILAHSLDWSRSRRVCDIGGGDGALLGVLLDRHRHLQGVVLELPEVVERAVAPPGVTLIAGDASERVPVGCDTYLLVNVLHDWSDDVAIQLLMRAGEAIRSVPAAAPVGRVVVLEADPGTRRDELTMRADLLMLALTQGGRERTRDEFANLASRAGLRLERSVALPSGDAAHVMMIPVPR